MSYSNLYKVFSFIVISTFHIPIIIGRRDTVKEIIPERPEAGGESRVEHLQAIRYTIKRVVKERMPMEERRDPGGQEPQEEKDALAWSLGLLPV